MHGFMSLMGLPWWLSGKEPTCQAGDTGLILGLGRSPGEGNGQPTPVFLPGTSHGQRNLGATLHEIARVGRDLATKQ